MSTRPNEVKRKAVLDAERSVNEQYRRHMEELLEREPEVLKQIVVTQSSLWTASAPKRTLPNAPASPVIGRVALEPGHPDSDLIGESFYIAGWRPGDPDEIGFEVVNWAAPIAALFFEGRAAHDSLAALVQGRRSFVVRRNDLVDYDDDIEPGIGDDPFDRSVVELQIPLPPQRALNAEDVEESPVPDEAGIPDEDLTTPDLAPVSTVGPLPGEPELRARDALFAVMTLPKSGHMGTILPTLQPEQYELISWPAETPLIVQGQPGTGKTVIAAHRAAFLTSEERRDARMARVAIVGPSDHYVTHIEPVLVDVRGRDSDIRVTSLPALLERIVGLRNTPKSSQAGPVESSWSFGRTIDRFVSGLVERPAAKRTDERVRAVIDLARAADEHVVPDAEHRGFLGTLPRWDELIARSQYLPMLAAVALALDPRVPGGPVAHLIIDEAQDVRPLEWRILLNSVLEQGGSVSLFGDMNQRRSDYTASDWKELAVDLEITDADGAIAIRELEVGYRSTKQILRFANRLLPRGTRGESALREGPEPTVRQVAHNLRVAECFRATVDLAQRHEGHVAWITNAPTLANAEFRRKNWVRGRLHDSWTKDDRTVVIMHPDQARGIEFDAVVVEEPADFHKNVGRDGVLYTSLTRPNKELVVIHSASLPKELKGRPRG